jgi:uncharacterized protein
VGDVIRRYPLISYFVIAYAGTWLVWALFVLSREGSGLLPFHSPASFLVLIGIGTFSGPTVGAFVVTAATAGAEGVVRLLWRIMQWRVGVVWYLFVLIGVPAIETLGTVAIPGALASATPIDWLPELISAAVFSSIRDCWRDRWARRSAGADSRSLVCSNSQGLCRQA